MYIMEDYGYVLEDFPYPGASAALVIKRSTYDVLHIPATIKTTVFIRKRWFSL